MGFSWHLPCAEWPESEQKRVIVLIDVYPYSFTDAHLQHIIDASRASEDEQKTEP